MSSVVSDDGTWQIDTNGLTWNTSSGGSVSVKTKDGKNVASMTVPKAITIRTKDNNINFGGGDMTVEGKSHFEDCSVQYVTGNIIDGSFTLGDGSTDTFQIKCKVDSPVADFPRFTASAETTITKAAKVKLPDNTKLQEQSIIDYMKDPLFDIAGIYLPGSKFAGWQKQLNMNLQIAGDGSKKTITAMVKLAVDLRPLFRPPKPIEPIDPFLEDLYKKFMEAVKRVRVWMAIKTMLDHQLEMLEDAQHTTKLTDNVSQLVNDVATATAALRAAAARRASIAAAFLEIDLVPDAAEVAADTALATESAQLAAAKSEKLVQIGFKKMTGGMIKDEIFAALTTAIENEETCPPKLDVDLSKQMLKEAVKEQFNNLAWDYGLERVGANENLDRMKDVLTKMRDDAAGKLTKAQTEQDTTKEEYDEYAENLQRSIIVYTLIESWETDVSGLHFLAFPDADLRDVDGRADAVWMTVDGDLNDETVKAQQVELMEKMAKEKGFTGFVLVPENHEAYFCDIPVGDLFNALTMDGDSKGYFSYIRAEKLSLRMIAKYWEGVLTSTTP